MNEERKPYGIHITHNDGDAVGCALVASLFEDDGYWKTYYCAADKATSKFIELHDELIINRDKSTELPEKILITDISISNEPQIESFITNFRNMGVKIISVDHHLTNPNKNKSWMVRFSDIREIDGKEEKVSAALLLFEYYALEYYKKHENIMKDANLHLDYMYDIPYDELKDDIFKSNKITRLKLLFKLVYRISRYDTWEWKNNKEGKFFYVDEDVVALMTKTYGPDVIYIQLHQYYTIELHNHIMRIKQGLISLTEEEADLLCYPPEMLQTYRVFKHIESKYTEKEYLEKHVKCYMYGEYVFASYINNNEYSNSVAEAIYNEYPDVDIVIVLYPENRKVGFRSKKSSIDVGRYAKRIYGGGGHPSASGAAISDTFIELLNKHYEAKYITELKDIL
jgi:oligoribonuclease NrnB/cAMP/cGMP phosphodiesterase (DHH superfamily)